MPKLNLANLNKSDIKYEVFTFNDGEPHIKLDEIDRKKKYNVICRICNPNDLYILMQVADILDRQGVEWELEILYLMSQRMDRVINFNESFSLQIVANILNGFNCISIGVFELHSERFLSLVPSAYEVKKWYNCKILNDCVLCYPDSGAYSRYYHTYDENSIVLSKKRDLNTGKITSIEIAQEDLTLDPERIVITDDLCDAGGTFIGAAKILREKYPNAKLDIFVRHMVNPIGIKNLSENFDDVYFTNSYKDWDNLPDNCHLIDVV